MSTVRLELPPEIAAGLDLETARDLGAVVAVIDGVAVVANVVTVASLVPHLRTLAAAIRSWAAGRAGERPPVLAIKGQGLDIRMELDPNVSTGRILRVLEQLADVK